MQSQETPIVHFQALEKVKYQDDAIISSEIVRNSAGTITIFAFDKGQGLSEHSAPFDAVVQVIDGCATMYINGEPHAVKQGEIIIMPANLPHALSCDEPFKMILTMIKGQ